jgi:DNA repair protein RecO (recombination protein O)
MTDTRRSAAATQVAFVLHSHDWSESSLILELFTRDAGRVVAAAKGAKRPTSQLRAVLMPFQRIAVQFARSRGDDGSEVRTLRSAEWGGEAAPMHGAAWFAGFYLNELLLRLLPQGMPTPSTSSSMSISTTRGAPSAMASRAARQHVASAQPPPTHPQTTRPCPSITALAPVFADDEPLVSITVARA